MTIAYVYLTSCCHIFLKYVMCSLKFRYCDSSSYLVLMIELELVHRFPSAIITCYLILFHCGVILSMKPVDCLQIFKLWEVTESLGVAFHI